MRNKLTFTNIAENQWQCNEANQLIYTIERRNYIIYFYVYNNGKIIATDYYGYIDGCFINEIFGMREKNMQRAYNKAHKHCRQIIENLYYNQGITNYKLTP